MEFEIRPDRSSQGRKKLHAERAKFFELITMATDMPVYFCDPASPWQRGSNENTNGLLRQHFPKGTDLSTRSVATLDLLAHELNAHPRKTLDWDSPAERLTGVMATGNL
jgi:IS30 family transposase